MGTWIIWLIVAAVLGVVEIVTARLAFGLMAVAALVGAGVGAIGGNAVLQVGAFAVASAAGLGIVRPFALRHIKQPPPLRTGTAALVGRSAYVLEEVTARSGRVQIGGEEWSARAYIPDAAYEPGAQVEVAKIEGATALVYE